MIQVVIDTNVVVSANLVDAGPSAAIFRLAVNRQLIRMCISPAVLKEYDEVLRRPRLKFARSKIENTLALIVDAARMVYPAKTLTCISHRQHPRAPVLYQGMALAVPKSCWILWALAPASAQRAGAGRGRSAGG